jgi:hypothetical protein
MKPNPVLVVLAALGPLLSFAAPQTPSSEAPAIQAVRVEKGPALDGRLDDEAWLEAPAFSGFKMVFPRPGDEPSEKTELRIIYDDSRLYIGVHCFDGEPGRISANSMAHDGDEEGEEDDSVRVLLDPFQDKRYAYLFVVNARGARAEGLALGEHASLSWDGIWDARCRLSEDGWTAEIAIPFKTISFNPGLACWGVNVERTIPRRQETIRLSGIRADCFFTNPAEAAALEDVGGIKQGLGLTFRPYGLASVSRNHEAGSPADWTWDGGFDLYKNFTPNFVGAFSYNTDFAETEVDERQVNLTRFPLYFPEKRSFFLEGSEIFNFGTTSAEGGFAPFFSRRIGLHEGRQVPVVFGTKAYGKLGSTNIQVLDVRTDALDGLPAENFLAARVSQNILAESKVGLIFTNGSPTGGRNSLAGFDLVYQTSRFMKDKNFLAGGWFVYNWNEDPAGRHEGFGFKLDYPNDLWDIAATYNSYGDALDPGVGFLPRKDIQVFNLGFNYMPRPEKGLVGRLVRQFFYELRFSFTWDLAGVLETRRIFTAPLNLQTESGEHFEFNVVPSYDLLPDDWEVSDGVFLPRGAYTFTNYGLQFETASHRPWTADLEWKFGEFYSGHYDDIEAGIQLKLKGYATLGLDANFVRGRLPEGNFKENVYQLKADFYLTPRLGLMNYVQYDDDSNELGVNTRFRWEVSPGNTIYFVYSKNWERRWDPASRFYPLEERGVFKITLSIRP